MPTLSRTPVDWQAYEAFCTEFKAKHGTVQGADAAYALSIGREPNAFSHLKRRHYRDQPQATAGGVPTVAPRAHPAHPERTLGIPVAPASTPGGIPDIASQGDLDRLTLRVERLEAFIATLPQRERGIPVAPNSIPGVPSRTESTPTTKHSFVVAVDTLEAIQQFAAAHHLHVKDALELLVRTGLEAHREGGRDV